VRVLIADDSVVSRHLLEATLRKWGYEVIGASDGAAAWDILQREDAPALAILDWMMPSMTGLEVCRLVRQMNRERYTYILLLTSRSQKEDLIEGMEAGADDYITKPFGMGELLARLRAALRRTTPGEEVLPIVQTADFRIDLATKRATNAQGVEIKLTPTQWHLVEVLVRSPDHLVSQRQLLEEVWGPTYTEQTNYLRQFMAQLRRKFEPDPAHPRYFLTEPGLGVRFVPDPQLGEALVTAPAGDRARG